LTLFTIIYKDKNMYHCNECNKNFENLVQFSKEEKMYQLCPHCQGEDIKLLTNITEEDKLRFLRENNLERIVEDKIVSKKEFKNE